MKLKIVSIVAVVLAVLCSQNISAKDKNSVEIKAMSYNIRTGTAKDGTNSWNFRYPATGMMLEDVMPDVFGIQEALHDQVMFIDEMCGNYDFVGGGRDDGKKKGEYTAIFWNKKTMKKVKWGMFWLSETPEKPSKGWDADCLRTATWAVMKHKKSGKEFLFVNTHLDHKGTEARKKGLALIMSKIEQLNTSGLPVVLTGDFNASPDSPIFAVLDGKMENTRKIAGNTDNKSTFNGWGKEKGVKIIDYIYVSGFSSCPEYRTVTEKYNDRKFISDHYPIVSRLIF